jgi:hypothetical protein
VGAKISEQREEEYPRICGKGRRRRRRYFFKKKIPDFLKQKLVVTRHVVTSIIRFGDLKVGSPLIKQ